MSDCTDIISALRELEQDNEVPKSARLKINQTITNLQGTKADRISLNQAISTLEVIGEDSNLQPMARTAVLGVLSLIESRAR